MSICLFPNMAYLSETSRAIAIYRALREAGESPLIATHGGTYEFVLQEERVPYHVVPPVMTPGMPGTARASGLFMPGRYMRSFSALKRRRLAGYIHSVLSDRRFAVNMSRLREWQARYDGPKNVARGLQEIARSVRCDERRSPGGNQIGSVATRQ